MIGMAAIHGICQHHDDITGLANKRDVGGKVTPRETGIKRVLADLNHLAIGTQRMDIG